MIVKRNSIRAANGSYGWKPGTTAPDFGPSWSLR